MTDKEKNTLFQISIMLEFVARSAYDISDDIRFSSAFASEYDYDFSDCEESLHLFIRNLQTLQGKINEKIKSWFTN